jgi:hypothetical protein
VIGSPVSFDVLIAALSHSGTPAATRTVKTSKGPMTTPRPRRRRSADGVLGGEKTGGDLLSQALAGQVPSALRGLTALFGKGRGVSPSP